jgi:hypothetical protein
MVITYDEIIAYVVGLELMCPECVTPEEAEESSKLADLLLIRGQIARGEGTGELPFYDRCHKRITD